MILNSSIKEKDIVQFFVVYGPNIPFSRLIGKIGEITKENIELLPLLEDDYLGFKGLADEDDKDIQNEIRSMAVRWPTDVPIKYITLTTRMKQ